jgi:hypothetical protein
MITRAIPCAHGVQVAHPRTAVEFNFAADTKDILFVAEFRMEADSFTPLPHIKALYHHAQRHARLPCQSTVRDITSRTLPVSALT